MPKVVTRRCLEQDLNPRPTDHKSNALPLHHRVTQRDTHLTHEQTCSDTLPVLVHPKTTRGLYEQLSVVCLWTGNARLVDQDEPGFEQLSSTSSTTISASTRRGSVRRNVPSGVNSWRRPCPVKGAPLDDDETRIWEGGGSPGSMVLEVPHWGPGAQPW